MGAIDCIQNYDSISFPFKSNIDWHKVEQFFASPPANNECWKVFASYFSSSAVRWEIETLFLLAQSHKEQGNCKTDNVQIYCHNLKGEEEEEEEKGSEWENYIIIAITDHNSLPKENFQLNIFLHFFFFFQIEFSPFQWLPNKLQFHLTLSLWAPMALADNILHYARRNPTQLGHQEHLLFFWALNTPSKFILFQHQTTMLSYNIRRKLPSKRLRSLASFSSIQHNKIRRWE